ncbi:MAG: DNA-binding response regulator [Acidobacteria bacterium]|nr:MAG: DNA-binding response regulator [Acidobacteriota bacterium]
MQPARPRILIVEDEEALSVAVYDRLIAEGYQAEQATDGQTGFQLALTRRFDAVILDVMLPGKSGFDVCRDLRQNSVPTPVLMLTARGQLVDKVLGLKLGADDYLTKPFEMMELLARLEALLRRAHQSEPKGTTYRFGEGEVDFYRTEVKRGGAPVELSVKEFQLLQHFIEHRGVVLSRDELLDRVWGYDATPVTRTVDVHVSWLRQKLEADPAHPQFILTAHRRGYKFAG